MSKRAILLAAAIAVSVAHLATARLGEAEAACAGRYGSPIKTLDSGLVLYAAQGWNITISFYMGFADSIHFSKAVGVRLSDEEITDLLQKNGGEKEWKKASPEAKQEQAWRTADGEMHAYLEFGHAGLQLETTAHELRTAAEKRVRVKRDTDGF